MAGPTTRARANWAVDRATSLSEVWAIVAKHLGLVGAWRLMLVCRAACAGAKESLATLPGLDVCGGRTGGGGPVSDVRRLNLATLRWETMPSLLHARKHHACCTVRGALVVLGGETSGGEVTSSVEMLSEGKEAFTALPPLSCGEITDVAAITVEESGSVAGQVLLLGGHTGDLGVMSTVHLVDLATGVCTPPQPNLLVARGMFAVARLPDECVVCAGGIGGNYATLSSAEILQPPAQGTIYAAWTQRELPALSVERYSCRGCVLSDGRFAVLGGVNNGGQILSSCEASAVGDGEHWEHSPPMHNARTGFACAAVAGCIIVVGRHGLKTVEVFDEVLDRWLRLPCDLPMDGQLRDMGSTLLYTTCIRFVCADACEDLSAYTGLRCRELVVRVDRCPLRVAPIDCNADVGGGVE
jgi:hypothetical protein